MVIFNDFGLDVVLEYDKRHGVDTLGTVFRMMSGPDEYNGITIDVARARMIRDVLDAYIRNDGVVEGALEQLHKSGKLEEGETHG